MDEIWRDIPNTNGKYQASNYGRIKSFARTNEHIMNPSKDKRGYLITNINGKTVKVHRMVAITFIDNPDNLPEINHINGIKDDNRVENLEWASRKRNIIHAYENGLIKRKGTLSRKDIHDIRTRYKPNDVRNSYRYIAEEYGLSAEYIGAIINGKKHMLDNKDTSACIGNKCVCPKCRKILFEIVDASYAEDFKIRCIYCNNIFVLNTPIKTI